MLGGLLWLAFYAGCSIYPILDMNEGLYAEIAREMLVSKNYVIPHLNFVPYLEKPPLLYWLIAANYKLFGVSELAARIVPSTCAVLMCVSLLSFGKRLGHTRAGWLAAMILASSLGFILINRTVFFDPLLNFLIWSSLACFYLWYQTDKKCYLRIAYIGLACGVLTKGFVALVIPGATALIFLLTETCSWRKRLQVLDGLGIALFLLLAVPWHLLAIMQQPNFAWDYFVNEQLYRFLDKRIPHDYHTGPIYFYLPLLLVYVFPWCFLLPLLFKTAFKDPLQKFLWLAFLVPLIIYSLSKAKGDYYMAVGIPPLAFLLGMQLQDWHTQQKVLWLRLLFFTIAGIVLLGIGLTYWANFGTGTIIQELAKLKINPDLQYGIGWMSIVLLSYIGLASGLVFIKRQASVVISVLAGLAILLALVYVGSRSLQQAKYSQKLVADYLQVHANNQPVYLYQDFERLSSLLFYYRQRLPIIDSKSHDLYFGSHTPAAVGGFIDKTGFLREVQQHAIYVVMRNDKVAEFQQLVANKLFIKQVLLSGRTVVFIANLPKVDDYQAFTH